MEVALRDARRPQAETPERGTPDAVWDVAGIMSKDILPGAPAERRRRSRLCALRAMDRLELLGEENLIPTLARRPALRWLADEGERGGAYSPSWVASASGRCSMRQWSGC